MGLIAGVTLSVKYGERTEDDEAFIALIYHNFNMLNAYSLFMI